jgi:hypothetical protein
MYESISVRDAIIASLPQSTVGEVNAHPTDETDTIVDTESIRWAESIRWTDSAGGVWVEHPTDPTRVRFLHDVDGNAPTAADWWLRTDVEKQFGQLTSMKPSDAYDAEWTKITNAAASLEDIVVMLKAAVTELRDNAQRLGHVRSGEDHAAARLMYDSYARVFTLRRKLSRVVASLGSGAPARLSQYNAAYDKLVQD